MSEGIQMAWESASVVVKLKEKDLPPEYLKRVGRELVQIILKRTAKGIDKDGKSFHGYSKDYIKSDDFQLAGKSKSRVNLELSGDMLADLSVLSARDGRIVIGFPDEDQRAKAHGHTTGANGSGRLPVRDFLGISEDELAEALRKIPPPSKVLEARKHLLDRQKQKDGKPFSILDELLQLAELTARDSEVL